MNREVCISHKVIYPFQVISLAGTPKIEPLLQILQEKGVAWESEKKNESSLANFVIDLGEIKYINFLTIFLKNNEKDSWPQSFRIEFSEDNQGWTSLIREERFECPVSGQATWHIPLVATRYLKLIVTQHYPKNDSFYSKIQSLKLGINGINEISASSELNRLWTKENIVDKRADYGWSTKISAQKENEWILFDLGSISHVNRIRLKSKDAIHHYFPKSFFFEYAKDEKIWYTISDEQDFQAENNTWYNWTFLPTNMRYLRIVITEGALNEDKNYLSQIIETEIFAVGLNYDHSHPHAGITPYATTLHAGLVRLAKDGERSNNVAVQGNDSRLKEATSLNAGIVRLAENGQVIDNAVVQANDKRLREATETYKGIVQLAKDGDSLPGLVVQSHDSRISPATEKNMGIVRLCAPGESSIHKAVQGNDPRLRLSSESFPGIVQLAKNGEEKPGFAVQSNDNRIKKATPERHGIVQFAKDGEVAAYKAVQADDRRLLDASELQKGIVRLAKDGETLPGFAVQANDRRLKPATTNDLGIVQLAAHGSTKPNHAVMADDPRLNDPRQPLPHEHDYAPLNHSFQDHNGYIWLEGRINSNIKDTNLPQKESALIGALVSEDQNAANQKDNKDADKANIGILAYSNITQPKGKIFGLLGHSPYVGVRGQALGNGGAGIEGHGRDCPGGRFISRNDFALKAGSPQLEDGSPSSGKGLSVHGISIFHGTVQIANDSTSVDSVIAYQFEADQHQPLSAGDIVRIHPTKPYCVLKADQKYDIAVIGVVIDQAAIQLTDNNKTNKVNVAIGGIVRVKVDPSYGEIKPGDLITTSKTAGHGMIAKIDNFSQIGSILGKALEPAKGKTTTILIALGKN